MARNFKELQAKMAPERRARVEKRVTEALKAMPPEGLRDTRESNEAVSPLKHRPAPRSAQVLR